VITGKVSVDKKKISFYAETAANLTSHTGNNWMLLLIDADNNSQTGWYGYDYLVNRKVKNEATTTLMRYDGSSWKEVADLAYRYEANKMELSIPRDLLGLNGDKFIFDFKWSDNPAELKDPISFCTDSDTAPNRRFNYRMIWSK
jgi:hypothetical protein